MWRALAPYLAACLLIMGGAAVAYSRGAPAWIAYAALLLAMVVLLPGAARWEERQHHR